MGGNYKKALSNIMHNVKVMTSGPWDLVAVDCAACGSALKVEYPRILSTLNRETKQAEVLSAKVRDVTQILAESSHTKASPLQRGKKRISVTYHDPCHLLKGQGIKEEPRQVLKSIPHVEYVEMNRADACCGGGVLQFEHPEVAERISAEKADAVSQSGARVVASGCPFCRLTLGKALKNDSIRVCHPVELIQPET